MPIQTNTRLHVLKQMRPQWCWTIQPKGCPELEVSTETKDLKSVVEQTIKMEEDLWKHKIRN